MHITIPASHPGPNNLTNTGSLQSYVYYIMYVEYVDIIFSCLSTLIVSWMHQQPYESGKIIPTMRDNEFLWLPCSCGGWGLFLHDSPHNPLPPRLINMHPVCEIISIQMSPAPTQGQGRQRVLISAWHRVCNDCFNYHYDTIYELLVKRYFVVWLREWWAWSSQHPWQ